MTVKMYCDGPECEEIALVTDPDWWLVQQLRETFHFHDLSCLLRWAQSSVELQTELGGPEWGGGAGACSHPWHLRYLNNRGGDCPRCGTLAVTEPVPGA